MRVFFYLILSVALASTAPAVSVGALFELGSTQSSNFLAQHESDDATIVQAYGSLAFAPIATARGDLEFSRASFADKSDYNYSTISVAGQWLPLPAESRIGISLGGRLQRRLHTDAQERYTSTESASTLGVAVNWSSRLSSRAAVLFQKRKYDLAWSGNQVTLTGKIGTNFTIWGRNTFDCELSGGFHNYYSLDGGFLLIDPDNPGLSLDPVWTGFGGVRLTWARPLFYRTGMNVGFLGEQLADTGDKLLYGATTGYLTPWDDLKDRAEYHLRLKSYAIPGVTLYLLVSLEHHRFHRAIEESEQWPPVRSRRIDYRSRSMLSIDLPLSFAASYLCLTRFNLGYIDSESNLAQYDYHTWEGSLTLSFELR